MFENRLNSLLLDEDVRIKLEKIKKVALSESANKRALLPHLHVISNHGLGVTTLGKSYAELLEMGKVFYPHCGQKNYLELTFPYNVSEREYKLFYQSAREAAGIQNLFWGVILVDLEEWKKVDISNDEVFHGLMNFVKANKDNIRFAFCTPFDEKFASMVNEFLRESLDVCTIRFFAPDEEQAWKYLSDVLKKKELVFSDDGKIAARNLVKKMSNMIDKRGYTLLHELGNRFEYECIADGTGKEIDDKMVLHVSKNILLEEKEVSERRIGFTS